MLFVNARGEVLLQLRDNIPSIRFPNHWGCIGGGVERGETPEQAMLREVDEELGIAPGPHEYIGTYNRHSGDIHIYTSRLDATAEALMPGLTEGQRVAWHTPQAAMMLPLVPWLEYVLPGFVRSEAYRRVTMGAYAPANEEAASVIFVNRARGVAPAAARLAAGPALRRRTGTSSVARWKMASRTKTLPCARRSKSWSCRCRSPLLGRYPGHRAHPRLRRAPGHGLPRT